MVLVQITFIQSSPSVIDAHRSVLQWAICSNIVLLMKISHVSLQAAITFVLSTLTTKSHLLLTLLRPSTSANSSSTEIAIDTIPTRNLFRYFPTYNHSPAHLVVLSWPSQIYWIDKVREHILVKQLLSPVISLRLFLLLRTVAHSLWYSKMPQVKESNSSNVFLKSLKHTSLLLLAFHHSSPRCRVCPCICKMVLLVCFFIRYQTMDAAIMCISRQKVTWIKILTDRQQVEEVDEFSYLGSSTILSSAGVKSLFSTWL